MIDFANSWKHETVRPWTEPEQQQFTAVVGLFNELAEASPLLSPLAALVGNTKFCVRAPIFISVEHGQKRGALSIFKPCFAEELHAAFLADYGLTFEWHFFDILEPGVWAIVPDMSGKLALTRSQGHHFVDADAGNHMVCICPTIYTRPLLAASVLCEELTHIDSWMREPGMSVQQLELEGIATRRELMQLARQRYFVMYRADILECEKQCNDAEPYYKDR